MKVFYHKGVDWSWTPTRVAGESNILSLSFNNWDDYGISTTLNAVLYVDKRPILEFNIKLLIEGDSYSPRKLNELREKGWDGYFPIPGVNYVSVPSDVEFYDAIFSKLGADAAASLLVDIRDAGYLVNVIKEKAAEVLVRDSSFETSPLREAGARKSFADGWKLFADLKSSIQDFTLYTPGREGGVSDSIRFRFNSKTLPYDINVLIGPNGIGKSYTLKMLVEYWLGVGDGSRLLLSKNNQKTFDVSPNISKLILISYSPFEEFALDLSKSTLQDKDAYKYFGFRKQTISSGGSRRVGISRNLPAMDSISSILKAFHDDQSFEYLSGWTNKADTIWDVLQPALGFDSIALELSPSVDIPSDLEKYALSTNNQKQYIKLNKSSYKKISKLIEGFPKSLKLTSGVLFFRGSEKVDLSSGQRLFCYIVINIVGQIKSDSLVIVDEPELFLHPSLEIEFISLLKKVLSAFNSKAILATHSLAIAREVPANCMHVYKRGEFGVQIDHPPFETFGGDMQRISSYVFSDNRVVKPYVQWVESKLKETGDPNALIQLLEGEINEELTIKILNSKVSNGS